jgi:MATE family multidrug resistance protein
MLRLAVPVVVVQVGLMLMGVVDTMVVGRLSPQALAAVALGNISMMTVVSFGFGMLLSVDPLVAQAIGANDSGAVQRAVQRGLILAILVAAPTVLVLLPIELILDGLRQPAEIVPISAGYIHRCLPGLLPYYCFVVLRQTLQAMERMRPIVVTTVGANLLNVLLDVAMVHGKWGFPTMGAMGSAWATTICRTALFVGLVVIARRDLIPLIAIPDKEVFRRIPLWNMARLGAPIGVQIQLEIGVLGVIALLMGGFGATQIAAHQVAINLASLTFMVPLGVSAAAAVRVGHAVGRGDRNDAWRAALAALSCGAGFMCVTAALFMTIPRTFASAYTPDIEVLALAVVLIPIAGVFQVFDGIQIVSAGILRGLGDTRAPMFGNLLGFWFVGLPMSLVLGFSFGLGPPGLWWGLALGLAASGLLLLGRVVTILRRPLARVTVE